MHALNDGVSSLRFCLQCLRAAVLSVATDTSGGVSAAGSCRQLGVEEKI